MCRKRRSPSGQWLYNEAKIITTKEANDIGNAAETSIVVATLSEQRYEHSSFWNFVMRTFSRKRI